MQLSFATGSERAAGGGGAVISQGHSMGWRPLPGPVSEGTGQPRAVTVLPHTALAPTEDAVVGAGVGSQPPWTPFLNLKGVNGTKGTRGRRRRAQLPSWHTRPFPPPVRKSPRQGKPGLE